MALIVPLIYIICFTETLMLIMKTKFERTLPLTFIISAIMLFISGFLFKTFYVGFIFCIIFSLGFPIYLIKNRKKIDIKKQYITPGFIAFIIIYLFIFIFDFNRFFTRWDELSHWGKMVKEMFKLDKFYVVNNSNLLAHKDYPPIMSLLQLFYTYLCGSFKECYLIRAMHLFEISIVLSIIPFKENEKKNLLFMTFIPLLYVYIITLLFDSAGVINSIYTDYIMAILVAYTIYNVYKIKELNIIDIITISLSLIFILLLKQVGIAFYLMTIFLLIVNMVLKKYKLNFKNILLSILCIIVLPLVFLGIWKNYVKSYDIKGQFEISDIKLNEVSSIINSKDDNYQKIAFNNYIKALYKKGITTSYIKISYLILGIIMLIIMYGFYKRFKKDMLLKHYLALCITLIIGYFGYALLMLILYMFSFGQYEGPSLASFDRYMSTYILTELFIFMFMFIKYHGLDKKDLKKFLIVLILIGITITPRTYIRIRPDLILLENHYFDIHRKSAELIDKYANNMDFSNKISTNTANYELSKFDDNYYEYMKDYKYLYTYTIDDRFVENYEFLFEEAIEEHTLYKINNDNNTIHLVKIDKIK